MSARPQRPSTIIAKTILAMVSLTLSAVAYAIDTTVSAGTPTDFGNNRIQTSLTVSILNNDGATRFDI